MSSKPDHQCCSAPDQATDPGGHDNASGSKESDAEQVGAPMWRRRLRVDGCRVDFWIHGVVSVGMRPANFLDARKL